MRKPSIAARLLLALALAGAGSGCMFVVGQPTDAESCRCSASGNHGPSPVGSASGVGVVSIQGPVGDCQCVP